MNLLILLCIASFPIAALGQHQNLGMEGANAQERGRTLFDWVWEPTTRPVVTGRADGLGPFFNARSCAECHHQGGSGGGGSIIHNIDIITAKPTPATNPIALDQLARIHQGLRHSPSVVLAKFSLDPTYRTYRPTVAGSHTGIQVNLTQRNTPSLFGLGLVDQIPDDVILTQAAKQKELGLRGQIAWTSDGKPGRFGWKSQRATLREFVEDAAAGELGLETTAKHQSADPRGPAEPAPAADLSQAQIDSIQAFVASLPKPTPDHQSTNKIGQDLFNAIGCSGCHVPEIGGINGLYSDLLLHEMKPELQESASYLVFSGGLQTSPNQHGNHEKSNISPSHWRTPPLWGIRTSAPYMHNGHAPTLHQAIAEHGGEAEPSAIKFQQLSQPLKEHLLQFLRSL